MELNISSCEKKTSDKKRYWLKLDKNFLKSSHIKVIKNMPNGKDYIIFYLSLMLESIETVGHLRFSDLVPYNEDMLASITDTNVDIVRSAVKIFENLGLMELLDDGTIYMTQVAQMTGKENESAERVRQYRLRKAQEYLLQCNANVTNSNDNKEKEEDKEEQDINNNNNKKIIKNKLESVSVSENQLNALEEILYKNDIIDDYTIDILVGYLKNGMHLEVIDNALIIPFNRNVMDFDFEIGEAPIKDPKAYSLTILENWNNFNVKTIEEAKKYNKLLKIKTINQ
jgi:predicted phage replisome organizer